jgi:hypothetical protein
LYLIWDFLQAPFTVTVLKVVSGEVPKVEAMRVKKKRRDEVCVERGWKFVWIIYVTEEKYLFPKPCDAVDQSHQGNVFGNYKRVFESNKW